MKLLAAAVMMVLTLTWANSARAQEVIAPDVYLNPGLLSVEDVETLTDVASLNDAQVAAARELLRGAKSDLLVARRRFDRGTDQVQDSMAAPDDAETNKKMATIFLGHWKQYLDDCTRIERQFMADLQSLLDASQREAWPRFERARRRLTLRYADTGVRVDLSEELRAMKLTPDEQSQVREARQRYEQELDSLIQQRRPLCRELDLYVPHQWYMENQPEMPEVRSKLDELDGRIADLQKRFSRLMASDLAPERADEFLTRYNRVTQSGWFGQLEDWDRLQTLLRLRGVTPEQNEAILNLARRADSQLVKAIRPYVEAMRERESDSSRVSDEEFERLGRDAWKEYMRIRSALWKDSLSSLTPEQRSGYLDGTDPADRPPDDHDPFDRRRRW